MQREFLPGRTVEMPAIEGLGHVGIHTEDLLKMRDFYTRVMGLQIADENLERGIVFLSANPEYEHHEFVLARGRDVPQGAKVVQQISFKVKSPEDLGHITSGCRPSRCRSIAL